MKYPADAASCAALAATLHRAAERLRASTGPARLRTEQLDLAADLHRLGDALSAFAATIREPDPPRAGRPFAHTALRTTLRTLLDQE